MHKRMQDRRLLVLMGLFILLAGAASFAAGRMMSRGLHPLALFGFTGHGISIVTDILPAEELPKIPPEVEGLYVARQDNLIFIQGSGLNQDPGGVEVGSPQDISGGARVEVLVTAETTLYRDTTTPPAERPTSDHNPAIQQTVEEGNLEDLIDSQTYIMVWGQRSGDRVIADVLVYSYLMTSERP